MVIQVLYQPAAQLLHQGRRQQGAGLQKMCDLAKNPGPALGGASHHDGVCAGSGQHLARFVGAVNVAIGHDGNMQCRFDRCNRVVARLATVALLPRAPVDGDHGHTRSLRRQRDGQRVLLTLAPAGAHLEGDRHVVRGTGGHDGLDDLQRQRLVLHQRRASPFVAHFFGRAAHIDVNDLRAAFDVVLRRLRHHGRVGAGNLYSDGAGLALVVGAARSLERIP